MDEQGRVEFTKEMKKDYRILIPTMLPRHLKMLAALLNAYGYHAELLENTGKEVIDTGLKYVHNDACYPATLVVGQFISALNSGKYDVHKTALFFTQTGGGCRASNYISLIRKALIKAGYGYIPVISLNFVGLEKNSGFKLSIPMMRRMLYSVIYGDVLMVLCNQVKAHEIHKGCPPLADTYPHFYPLENRFLENYLIEEGAEPNMAGLMDFALFYIYGRVLEYDMYRIHKKSIHILRLAYKIFVKKQQDIIDAIHKESDFDAPTPFAHTVALAKPYVNYGVKMGEGWLLVAEMVEHIDRGTNNIVITQPFGCLPNHIVGKGVMKVVKDRNPGVNLIAIDYDASASEINQQNRIKLLLANAKQEM